MPRTATKGGVDEGVTYVWPHIWQRMPEGDFYCQRCGTFTTEPTLFNCEKRTEPKRETGGPR